MRVNRMYFRGGKTPLLRLMVGLIALSTTPTFAELSRTEPEQHEDVSSTPDWAKGMIWYQIFPERFRNGNPNNDPAGWDLVTVEWSRPFDDPSIAEIESIWNRRIVDPRRYGFDPDRFGGAARNTIFNRRDGGDLIGIYEQLEDLASMGVTGIYLCPIFESRSLHKYDAWDHRHIDPTLGHPGSYDDSGSIGLQLGADENASDETTWTWTPADQWFVDVFLPKAKSLGLRVVLDGVWNHVGLGHWAFHDVREHGQSSRFVDWFDARFDPDGQLIGWCAWDRTNGNLPAFRQIDGDLAPGPKAHVMAVTRRWMDPNNDGDPSDGIDGWRLDVANEVVCLERLARNSPIHQSGAALIIGEIWFDAKDYFDGTAFDGQMNYPAAYAITDWLSTGGPIKGDANIAAQRLTEVFHHGWDHDLVQFNLMSSHDTERLASMMFNDFPRGFDQDASIWDRNTRYDAGEVDEDARTRALMAIAALVALPGSVMIYNGDEYAMPGADDPDNRRPIPWDTLNDENLAFRDAVQWLVSLRTDPEIGEVLRLGHASFEADESRETLIVRRTFADRVVEIRIGGESRGETSIPSQVRTWFDIRKMDG